MGLLDEPKKNLEAVLDRYGFTEIYSPSRVTRRVPTPTTCVYDIILMNCYAFNNNGLEPFLQPIEMEEANKKNGDLFISKDDSHDIFKTAIEDNIKWIIGTNGLILINYKENLVETDYHIKCDNCVHKGALRLHENESEYGRHRGKERNTINNIESDTNKQDVDRAQEDRTMRFKDVTFGSNMAKALTVETDKSKIEVDFHSHKYRFCKNKAFKRLTVNLLAPKSTIQVSDRYTLTFNRNFSGMEYCTENRFNSLSRMIGLLYALGINPIDFLKSRILGFYNQDISALELSHDLNIFWMLFPTSCIDLSDLLSYVQDSIIELFGDHESIELYLTIIHLTITNNKVFKNGIGGDYNLNDTSQLIEIKRPKNDTMGEYIAASPDNDSINSKIDSYCITFHNECKSKESSRLYNNLKRRIFRSIEGSIKDMNGIELIYNVYKLVEEYKMRLVYVDKSYVEQRLYNCKVNRREVIAASILLERMGLPVLQGLLGEYKSAVKSIGSKFCTALDAMLKSGNLYGIYDDLFNKLQIHKTGLEGSLNPELANLLHSNYLKSLIYEAIEKTYLHRIKRCKTMAILSIIYKSAVEYQKLFGYSIAIELALKEALSDSRIEKSMRWADSDLREFYSEK